MNRRPYTSEDLIRMAIRLGGPEPRDPVRSLATYADKSNWESVHAPDKNGNMRHYWAWVGPVIVGYELAESSLSDSTPNLCHECGEEVEEDLNDRGECPACEEYLDKNPRIDY